MKRDPGGAGKTLTLLNKSTMTECDFRWTPIGHRIFSDLLINPLPFVP